MNLPVSQAARESTSKTRRRWPRFSWAHTTDFYVVRSFIGAYLICAVSFIGLFVLIEAFAKLDRFLRPGVPLLSSLGRYYLAMIPTVYVNFMGPVLTLAAAMFALTALNRQNELTPLKAAGVSIYRIVLPIFVLATLLSIFTFFLQERVIPQFKDSIRSALALSRARPLNPPPYFDRESGYLIRVSEYSTTRKIAQGVEVSDVYANGKAKRQIDANRMEWVPGPGDDDDGHWVLHNGSLQRWDEDGNLVVNAAATDFERLKTSFRRFDLEASLRPIDLESSDLDISYLSSRDLKTQYQRQPYHNHLAVKLHHHFAFPFSHIILLLLGIPFVLHFQNRNVFLSLGCCFVICALFFLVSSICMNIANHSDIFSPVLAAWLPVMLFGSVGMTLFDHLPT